jgi:hypothetical protein
MRVRLGARRISGGKRACPSKGSLGRCGASTCTLSQHSPGGAGRVSRGEKDAARVARVAGAQERMREIRLEVRELTKVVAVDVEGEALLLGAEGPDGAGRRLRSEGGVCPRLSPH